MGAGVLYPSLLQLEGGMTETEDKRQKAICSERYMMRKREEENHWSSDRLESERDDECGICMEMNPKIVVPTCNHAMCFQCYNQW